MRCANTHGKFDCTKKCARKLGKRHERGKEKRSTHVVEHRKGIPHLQIQRIWCKQNGRKKKKKKKKKRKEGEKGKANLHEVSQLLSVTTTSTGNQKMDSNIVAAPNFDFFFLCFLDHPEVELRGGKRSRGVGDILNIFRLPQTRDFFFTRVDRKITSCINCPAKL